jgi:hypothetical protein
MKFLRNVAGYTRKDHLNNNKLKEKLKMFNLHKKILKSRLQWKYHVLQTEDRRVPKIILTHNPPTTQNDEK